MWLSRRPALVLLIDDADQGSVEGKSQFPPDLARWTFRNCVRHFLDRICPCNFDLELSSLNIAIRLGKDGRVGRAEDHGCANAVLCCGFFRRRRHERDQNAALFKQSPGPRLSLGRSEAHTSELQSLIHNSYAVFCLPK